VGRAQVGVRGIPAEAKKQVWQQSAQGFDTSQMSGEGRAAGKTSVFGADVGALADQSRQLGVELYETEAISPEVVHL
jgi:hypothetical protein